MKSNKPARNFQAPLQELTTSSPFELVALDFLHLEKAIGGCEYILLIQDNFTRFCQAYATKNKSATTAAKHLFNDFIMRFGAPARIHHDQGREFENNLFHTLEKKYGISRSRTTSYHPQGNGQVERLNRTLLQMLRTLAENCKSNWPDSLNKLIHAYNCTQQESTGFSPYFLLFGRNPRLPIDLLLEEQETKENHKSFQKQITEWQESMHEAHRIAAQCSKQSKKRNKKTSKIKYISLEIGDRVLVKNMREKGGPGKIRSFWEQDIYKIVSIKDDAGVVYEVVPEKDPKSKTRILHRNMLLPCDHLPLDLPTGRDTKATTQTCDQETPQESGESESDNESFIITTRPATHEQEERNEDTIANDTSSSISDYESSSESNQESSSEEDFDNPSNSINENPSDTYHQGVDDRGNSTQETNRETESPDLTLPDRPKRNRQPKRIFTYDHKGNPTYTPYKENIISNQGTWV